MEQIDYEQKYKEALGRAKRFYDANTNEGYRQIFEDIFEELRESEDEKIRKELVRAFTTTADKREHEIYGNGITYGQVLAWIEKQGEQNTVSKTEPITEGLTTEFQKQVSHLIASAMDKEHEYTKGYVEWVAQSLLGYAKNEQTSTNKVKPKFKVGDWIIQKGVGTYKVVEICKSWYEVIGIDGNQYSIAFIEEKNCHHWTIQDARNGDVLVASDGSIFIFKEIRDYGCKHYIALEEDGETINVNNNLEQYWETIHSVKPSTKEQCDLLFSKMKEAGYEWDAEKKELRKTEQKPTEWSDRDWYYYSKLESFLEVKDHYSPTESSSGYQKDVHETLIWLKSLKDRYTWKPSDEQMEALQRAIDSYSFPSTKNAIVLKSLYEELKKLREE